MTPDDIFNNERELSSPGEDVCPACGKPYDGEWDGECVACEQTHQSDEDEEVLE